MDREQILLKNALTYEDGHKRRTEHILKVYSLTRLIAISERVSDEELKIVSAAAILHDIPIKKCKEIHTMILYFSATGNSRYAAKRIAEATGDKTQSLQEVGTELTLQPGENLGIITPVYFQGLPSVVEDLLYQLTIHGDSSNYIYTVFTYGTFSGRGNDAIGEYLKKFNLKIHADYTVKTADTWTTTFDLSDKEKVVKVVSREEPQLGEIIRKVQKKENGHFQKNKPIRPIANMIRASYDDARKTEHLHVSDACIGCGLCEKNCPVGAIQMKDGKPDWVKEQCTMCLQCLHKCPKFAIQYVNDRT